MVPKVQHILVLHDEHDRGDQKSPSPPGSPKQTENHCRHRHVKQQHEVGEIREGNHSNLASAVRSTLPLAVIGNASRKTNLRGNIYAGSRSPSWVRRLCANVKSELSFRASRLTNAVSD